MAARERGAGAPDPSDVLASVRGMESDFIDLLSRLARVESPTDRPETQAGVQALLVPELEALGFRVRVVRGRISGGHLLAVPRCRVRGAPAQLLIGHSDTVWPIGTLERMPVRLADGRLHGPGTLDMKGGLTQMLIALRALRALEVEPEVTPIVFINSDEEIGSPDSAKWVHHLARRVCRAFVLEPAMGPEGLLKTARKGVGRFEVTLTGRAAHAGLEPERGASAILELARVIERVHALAAAERGTTLNVGVVQGGTRPNVVAARATASVDVRVTSMEEGDRIAKAMSAIAPTVSGVTIEVTGGIGSPPLERTPRNRALWERARRAARGLGLELGEALVGGGSDGNTTSQHTATLDGLGCLGDGAHAEHEHVVVAPSLERAALLARLLLMPARSDASE